jgi:CheY-like chemotaxis protein
VVNPDQKPSLLLIDDEPDQAYLVELAAKRCDHYRRVTVETDPAAAWEYLERSIENPSELPDIVVIDWKMPCLNGAEFAQRLAESPGLRHIPIVVLSSSDFEKDRAAAYALGCRAFLQKPIGFSELVDLLCGLSKYADVEVGRVESGR